MTYSTKTINSLRRPKLLIRAARAGMAAYVRTRDLACVQGVTPFTSTDRLVEILMSEELLLEQLRSENSPGYDLRKHIRVLTALLAETGHSKIERIAA